MSHPLRSPRVLTNASMDEFENLVETFLRHGRNGTTSSPEAEREFAGYARRLAASYLDRCFWDRRKR